MQKFSIISFSLLILLILLNNQASGCDCRDYLTVNTLRSVSYNHSELIFYGELIEFNTIDYSYTFEIIELFKGERRTKIVYGKYYNTCSLFPTEKCKWIVYANYMEKDTINISGCLFSRSELHPYYFLCYPVPPPPPPIEETDTNYSFDYDKHNEEISRKATKDFIEEILILRRKENDKITPTNNFKLEMK